MKKAGNEVAPTSAFPSSCGGQQTWERGDKDTAARDSGGYLLHRRPAHVCGGDGDQ
jgi:hypothetical protein